MAKDIISAYRSVCRDLRGLEAYLPVVTARLEAAHRVVFEGRMPGSVICYVPLTKTLPNYNTAVDEYNETVKTIDQLKKVKEQIEQTIGFMSDAEQVVILMHVEQGMNLREIAEKSNYSYDYLRRVSRKIKIKEVTESPVAS